MIVSTEATVISSGRIGPRHRHGLSRRQLLAAGGGALLGTQLLGVGPAQAARTPGTPRPIPGGFELGGTLFHVVSVGQGEPNSITDFNGFVGAAQVDGHGTGADVGRAFDVDNRFIVGEYIATDGKRYHADFGFLWLDVYEGSVDPTFQTQIHDFNPGIAPNGLFWTVLIPAHSVTVSPGTGAAAWTLSGFRLPDFGSIPNALFGSPIGSGVLDMTMTWSGGGEVTQVRDAANGFVGRKVTGTSHIEFAVDFGSGTYTAASEDQVSLVSEVWKERNGVYFS